MGRPYPGIEQDLTHTIRLDLKQWCVQNFIPAENLGYQAVQDPHRWGFSSYLQWFMAGQKDHQSSRDWTDGETPASLMDWVRFHINRALPSWMEPLKVKTITLHRHHHETWRVCPHLSVNQSGSIRPHLHFMEYGGDFDKLTDERRLAAQRIVAAAVNIHMGSLQMYPPLELLRAVHEYRRSSGYDT